MKNTSIVLLLIYIFHEKKINSTTVDLYFYEIKIKSTTADLFFSLKI